EPEYYERMLTMIGQKFSELLKIGEAIEDGLKTGKIGSKVTQANTTGFVRKKKEDVSSLSYSPASRPRGNFGSNSTVKTPSRLSLLNNHPQAPYSPYPIFYAQPNFQPPPQIYPNFQHNYKAPTPVYQNPQNYNRATTSSPQNTQQNHPN
ncbi:hypothetical protein HAX54_018173, partial [Datura stramonium]|nr:hypothetical protein [Datura stramonium]